MTDLDARVAALMDKADRFADERGESTHPVDSQIYRNYLEQAIRAELQKPALHEPVTLPQRIAELVEKHESLRATARVLEIDPGYLSRLASGEKCEPGATLLRRLGLRQITTYERV